MKKYSILAMTFVFGLSTLVIANNAMAGDSNDLNRPITVQVGVAASNLDDKTTGANIRVSQLIGMDIKNPQGKSVGEINDIVLNSSTAEINYVAVTYGGFLGVGNKMFAVPFKAFKVQQDKEDSDEYVLILNVTKKQLEGATGFDEDHWPNFADPHYNKELHERYGIKISIDKSGVRINSK